MLTVLPRTEAQSFRFAFFPRARSHVPAFCRCRCCRRRSYCFCCRCCFCRCSLKPEICPTRLCVPLLLYLADLLRDFDAITNRAWPGATMGLNRGRFVKTECKSKLGCAIVFAATLLVIVSFLENIFEFQSTMHLQILILCGTLPHGALTLVFSVSFTNLRPLFLSRPLLGVLLGLSLGAGWLEIVRIFVQLSVSCPLLLFSFLLLLLF